MPALDTQYVELKRDSLGGAQTVATNEAPAATVPAAASTEPAEAAKP